MNDDALIDFIAYALEFGSELLIRNYSDIKELLVFYHMTGDL